MRKTLWSVVLFALLALPAFSPTRAAPSAAPSGDAHASALAELEAPTGGADSTPLHTVGEILTVATVLETPRRLNGARLQIVLGLVVEQPASESDVATQLRLRAAARDRRAIGDALERDAAGSTSFHTTTPPPSTLA